MASDIILNLIQISFIIVVVLLFIGPLFWYRRTRKAISSIFDHLALRYGGRVEILQPENRVGMERILHSLKFPYRDTELFTKILKISVGNSVIFQTCFGFNIDTKKSIYFIIRRRYRAIDIKAGMPEIHFENKEFERRFHVEGDNEDVILQILTSTLQEKLMRMKGVNVIKFWLNSFQLTRSNRLRNEEEYEQYIELTKSFYDRMSDLHMISF